MKKTLIALAIASMVATSANAVTIYEQEGTKLDLDGSVRLWLGKDGGNLGANFVSKFKTNERINLVNDDSRVHFKLSQKITDNMKAIVGWELRFKGNEISSEQAGGTDDYISHHLIPFTETNMLHDNTEGFGGIQTRQLYAGFDFANIGTLTFGRQATTADDVLQDDLYFRSGRLAEAMVQTSADKSVKFRSADWYGFSFGLDYLFGHQIKRSPINNPGNEQVPFYKRGHGASLFYHYDFAEDHKIEAAAAFTDERTDGKQRSSTDRIRRSWLLSTHYTLGGLKLGAAYGQTHSSHVYPDEKSNTAAYLLLEAKYNLQNLVNIPSTVAVQWERYNIRSDRFESGAYTQGEYDKRIYNQWIAQIDYKVTKNVVPYIQYSRLTYKTKRDIAAENIYGVGLRVYF